MLKNEPNNAGCVLFYVTLEYSILDSLESQTLTWNILHCGDGHIDWLLLDVELWLPVSLSAQRLPSLPVHTFTAVTAASAQRCTVLCTLLLVGWCNCPVFKGWLLHTAIQLPPVP